MNKGFFPYKPIPNSGVARPVNTRVFVWLGVMLVVGALIASGFVISARNHVESVSLGYETEELRREAARLDERLRQLELELARASSPVEIEKRATKLGLRRPVSARTAAR